MNAVVRALQQSRPDLDDAYQRDMDEAKRMAALLRRTFDLGAGDTDLYHAFGWRFWHLTAEGGAVGVVLPRQALTAPAYQKWRTTILANGAYADTTILLNTGGWVFDDAEPRYTIALCSIRKGRTHAGIVAIRGPYSSRLAYDNRSEAAEISTEEFRSWSKAAMFPLFPSDAALSTFRRLRNHPRLDRSDQDQFPDSASVPRWRVRAYRELDSAKDKHRFALDAGRRARTRGSGFWPVYAGRSFNLWEPDTGKYYASTDAEAITSHLQTKRQRGHQLRRSVFFEFGSDRIEDSSTLAFLQPRILFRDVTRATDTRTVRLALVPGELVAMEKAPSLVWPKGAARDEAYLLGILSSMVLDWYARRLVETKLSFTLLNGFPIPDCDTDADSVAARVVEIAGRLSAVDDRFAGWAAEVGGPVGSVRNEATKHDLICELDACVAHLYGLDESDLTVIYETFHEGADYSERCSTVVGHFRRWGRR